MKTEAFERAKELENKINQLKNHKSELDRLYFSTIRGGLIFRYNDYNPVVELIEELTPPSFKHDYLQLLTAKIEKLEEEFRNL